MKCEEVQASFVFFLDGEVTPEERTAMKQHLAGCESCRDELAALAAIRKSTGQVLQSLAGQAAPPPQAWDRLQTKLTKPLAKRMHPSPAKLSVWLSRLAQGASDTPIRFLKGDLSVRKRILFPAFMAVIALILVAAFLARGVAPVSAQQILDRAYQAQSTSNQAQGIAHRSIEIYQNLRALPAGQADSKTIVESYNDFQTGNLRTVSTNAADGQVVDTFAFDGASIYTARGAGEPDGPLTVYRSPQRRENIADLHNDEPATNSTTMFDSVRNDPNVTFVGQETWPDGHEVYILRSQQPVKVHAADQTQSGPAPEQIWLDEDAVKAKRVDQVQTPLGFLTLYFDTKTYQLLGSKATIQRDGKEIQVNGYRVLVDEVLPAGSPVAWDLSDLRGIAVVDDPQGEHGNFLPEVITPHELASHTSAYLLKTVPEGFTLEISAAPHQPDGQPYSYVIAYRSPTGDYFVMQPGDGMPQDLIQSAGETYQTSAGLVLHLLEERSAPGEQPVVSAIVERPDGKVFLLNSTLPLERVKALAEDLVAAQ